MRTESINRNNVPKSALDRLVQIKDALGNSIDYCPPQKVRPTANPALEEGDPEGDVDKIINR